MIEKFVRRNETEFKKIIKVRDTRKAQSAAQGGGALATRQCNIFIISPHFHQLPRSQLKAQCLHNVVESGELKCLNGNGVS